METQMKHEGFTTNAHWSWWLGPRVEELKEESDKEMKLIFISSV